MNLGQFVSSVLLTGAMVVLVTTPTRSEEILSIKLEKSTASNDKSTIATQQAPLENNSRFEPTRKIRRLSEIEHPAKSAQMLVGQSPTPSNTPQTEVVQVTAVKANPSNKGVEVILQTSQGEQLQVTNRSSGNNFIADIPNAQLRLPSGEAFTFRSDKPIAGVTEITVTNFDANTIRVSVTGETGVPTVELYDSPNEGLIFSVASAATSTPQQQPQTQPTQPPSQSESQTQPSQPSSSGDEPIELVVTGEQDGYRVPDATTATRTDTPIRDIPQSIQVIPQQVIQDQGGRNLNDVLRNVSGAATVSPPEFFADGFKLRGFDSQIFLDGVKQEEAAARNTTGLERVEVLKGPSAVLFGQGGAGGLINLVTKKPLRDPYYAAEFTVGNYNFYLPSFDISGPLNEQKTVLYRLNGSYQDAGSFIDFFEIRRWYVAPSLSVALGPNTTLLLETAYQNDDYPSARGVPARGSVFSNPNGRIPRSRNIAEPGDYRRTSDSRVGYTLEHQFSPNWSLRNVFRFSHFDRDDNFAYALSLDEDARTLNRGYVNGERLGDVFTLVTDVIGNLKTGSISHKLLFGVELYRYDNYKNRYIGGDIASIDLFNPVYGSSRISPELSSDDSSFDFYNSTRNDFLGIYVQDQISFSDNLKLLLGGRFDIVSQQLKDRFDSANDTFQQDEAFSPRVGIVYQPIQPISLYASWSRSFQQVTGSGFDNRLFEPEKGEQFEIGAKADLNPRLTATLALYQLTRSNVLTTPGNQLFSIQTGKQRSRGIELDLSGEILPGWNIIASYAYTDAQIVEDEVFPEGNQLSRVPKNSASLWTTYEIQTSSLKGLGFGVGVFYVGEREGDLDNSFTLPSYVRTDAAIFYKTGNFKAALNFKNLANIRYFETAEESDLRVYYGAPFTVQGTISFTF